MHGTYIKITSDLINIFKINMFSVQAIFNKIQRKEFMTVHSDISSITSFIIR